MTARGLIALHLATLSVGCTHTAARTPEPTTGFDRQKMIGYLSSRELEPIEGIWSWSDNSYEVAIVRSRSSEELGYEYGALLTSTMRAGWAPGELKMLLKATASDEVFTGIYLMANKARVGITLVLEPPNLIDLYVPAGPSGSTERVLLLRVFPKSNAAHAEDSTAGTGFVVGKGLVATAFHVVKESTSTEIVTPGGSCGATLLAHDDQHDLAILAVDRTDPSRCKTQVFEKCLAIGDSESIAAGDRVYTLGYPLRGLLSRQVGVAEGIVSNTRGFKDDPSSFQVSVPVQPGNSGGPLFDSGGNVIGVVEATLRPEATLGSQGVVPQNVNFATKSEHLREILKPLPRDGCKPQHDSPRSAADFEKLYSDSVVQILVRTK